MNKADALCEQMFSVPFGKLKKKKETGFRKEHQELSLI